MSTVFKRLITPSVYFNLCECVTCCVTKMLAHNLFCGPVNVFLCVGFETHWRSATAYSGT